MVSVYEGHQCHSAPIKAQMKGDAGYDAMDLKDMELRTEAEGVGGQKDGNQRT